MPACLETPKLEAVIPAGDTFKLTIVALDEDDQPLVITGWQIDFLLLAWNGGGYVGSPLITKGPGDIVIVDDLVGKFRVWFDGTETEALDSGTYYCIARGRDVDDNRTTLQPFLADVFQTPFP